MTLPDPDEAVSVDEGVRYRCTDCNVPAGTMCVYQPPMHYGNPAPLTRTTALAWSRVGTARKRIHPSRFRAVRLARQRAIRDKEMEDARHVPERIKTAMDIHAAEIEYDLIERRKLIGWLARHSSLLTVQSPPAVDER